MSEEKVGYGRERKQTKCERCSCPIEYIDEKDLPDPLLCVVCQDAGKFGNSCECPSCVRARQEKEMMARRKTARDLFTSSFPGLNELLGGHLFGPSFITEDVEKKLIEESMERLKATPHIAPGRLKPVEDCSRCRFFLPRTTDSTSTWTPDGRCRRRSPSTGNMYQRWPETFEDDWCGEFKRKEKA